MLQKTQTETFNEEERYSPYARLQEREKTLALSTTPAQDAQLLTERFGLQPSTAVRFEKAYLAYAQQTHREHVLQNTNRHKEQSAAFAITKQKMKETIDDMVGILADSQSPFFGTGTEREAEVRGYLESLLKGPQIDETRGSDYRYITGVRQQLEDKPEKLELFNKKLETLKRLADDVLDPSKISQYTGPLMLKQTKDMASELSEAGIKDAQAIGNRVLNIFTKQVDLVQGKQPATLAKA